ncbi:Ferrous-iron efflux pump FieF [Planctomycetes bacterium Pan216]|uniref:Ferrous-iron efflux pump FieF n=1 Tax=Kolteria novifilia TaxID=2527975 RepID=A0A518B1J6_9BACT|nr:Ferrous-iron efflux pump FieF [Planctomycetes bacterium Pan216]
MDPRRLAMIASLVVSAVMLSGKSFAFFLTHSSALLADALESVVHLAATGFAAYSLWYAARPADRDHPYGHGRIAYFSAGFEGALVFAASIAVMASAVHGFLAGEQLHDLGIGFVIAVGLAVLNLILGMALVWVGRNHHSLILVANGKHVLADVWTTLAAIIGLGLVMLTGNVWIDPLAAGLIGLLIMWSGWSLIRRSYLGLMDRVDPEQSQRLVGVIESEVERLGISSFHQLRYRIINDQVWIELHVQVPGDMNVTEAHRRVTKLEHAVRTFFDNRLVWIVTHIEPIDHHRAHPHEHRGMIDPLQFGTET